MLYGSRAKGTHRPGSDIDLALVGLDDPPVFDVTAYGGIADGPLREHIARVGVSLYRRDPPDQTEAE